MVELSAKPSPDQDLSSAEPAAPIVVRDPPHDPIDRIRQLVLVVLADVKEHDAVAILAKTGDEDRRAAAAARRASPRCVRISR